MKFSYFLVLIFASFIVFTGCKDDNYNKNLKAKREASKKKPGKSKTASKSNFWVLAQKNAGLTKIEVDKLKKSNKIIDTKIAALKKAKKWDGQSFAKTRTAIQQNKVKESKKILGAKYSKFEAFRKNWVAKNAPKASKKKKATGKKKPAKKVAKKKKK